MLLGSLRKKRKKSHKQRKLQKSFLKITKDEESRWYAYCEYGHVRITSGEKFIRLTVAKPNNKSVHHMICKYDKFNNFRVYYSCNQGVMDITYNFPFSSVDNIKSLLKVITNVNDKGNHTSEVYKQFFSRFIELFGDSITKQELPYTFTGAYSINKLVWRLIYPMSVQKDEGMQLIKRVPSFIGRASRAYDPKEFTKRLFGRAPKSLIKAVILHLPLGSYSVNVLFLARVFYHIWPIDKVVEFIKTAKEFDIGIFMFGNNSNYGQNDPDDTLRNMLNINLWRKFLKPHSPNKILNWVRKYEEDFGTYAFDALKQIVELEERGVTVGKFKKMDIKGIHDIVSRYYLRLKKDEVPLPVWDNLYNLEGKDCFGYKILFPKTNFDLINWGKHLHNCIGSYEREALRGKSALLALTQNDSVKYCAEFNPPNFELRQCHGKFNRKAPEEVVRKLKKIVASAFKYDKLGTPKKAKLVVPDAHKAKFLDITDQIDLESWNRDMKLAEV